jgi:hypothetical protein
LSKTHAEEKAAAKDKHKAKLAKHREEASALLHTTKQTMQDEHDSQKHSLLA